MKSKDNKPRFLYILAILSFFIATVQGALYYSSYELFFKLLLVLQNSINAFGFKATVTIKDVVSYMNSEPTVLNKSVGYLYCIAVFTAPYCTISFMYKFLERILRLIINFRRGKNCEHILIFGYNSDVKSMLRNNKSIDLKKNCVHIITAEDLATDEFYRLNKKGYLVHMIDVLKANESELPDLLEKIYAEKAKNVILFEDSSIRNFSLLQLFRLNEADDPSRIKLPAGAKISCRCEEDGISRLIAEYYDKTSGTEAFFDLELIGLPEMQIHKMYSEIPLHTVYKNSDTPLHDWDVHLLVVGLGTLGMEAVLQAMNLGVVHEGNRIVIDVADPEIESKKHIFMNQFSEDTFDFSDSKLTLKSSAADGHMEINFYSMNAKYNDFYNHIRQNTKTDPYTYAVITLEDVDLSVNCVMQIEEIFCEHSAHIPILMRMDSDRRLAGYISDASGVLADVSLIDDRSCVITLDMIINREIDKRAKEYNHFYNNISIISADDTGTADNSDADAEKEWNKIRLFRRLSSKAAAYHDEVKNDIIPRLAAENGVELKEKLEQLLGPSGLIMQYTGKAWRMNGTEQELLEQIKNDRFAYTLASLEHRRWCCYMASIGWRCGERSDRFRRNPCIVTQEELMKKLPDMCKYDLMSLMARYQKL
ncbi:MAG: hypothetical protein E7495_01895 [Ruminococcus flavefaciens]|jgi:hypothetical protein|nr:hypothetical protein [Ruminococcus flavefaciens]